MKRRASATTITHLTSSPDFADISAIPPAPTTEDLIRDIRATLEQRVADAESLKMAFGRAAAPRNVDVSIERGREQLEEFEKIVSSVPLGFKLVPVYYSRISQASNETVLDEYLFHVRSDFLRYVADKHTDELRALGISEHGIGRMKKGLDPSTQKGDLYHVSIDHIIERSGGGNFSLVKQKDPDLGEESPQRFSVNHYGNLILLPEKIHQFKNTLNSLQRITDVPPGEGRWALMMIPERTSQYSGFVAQPQDPDHPLFGVETRPMDLPHKISHTAFVLGQAYEGLKEFRRNPVVSAMLTTFSEVARLRGTYLDLIANDNNIQAPTGEMVSLRQVFDHAMRGISVNDKRRLDRHLKPVIAETTDALTQLFDDVQKRYREENDRKAVESFFSFFNSRKVWHFRDALSQIPLDESSDFMVAHARIYNAMNDIKADIVAKGLQPIGTKPSAKPAQKPRRKA